MRRIGKNKHCRLVSLGISKVYLKNIYFRKRMFYVGISAVNYKLYNNTILIIVIKKLIRPLISSDRVNEIIKYFLGNVFPVISFATEQGARIHKEIVFLIHSKDVPCT